MSVHFFQVIFLTFINMTGTGPVLLLAFSSKISTFLYLVSNIHHPEALYPPTTASIFDWFIPVQFEPKNYILVSNHAVRANFYIIKAWILLQLYWNYHNRFWIPWYRSKTQYFQTSHPTFLWKGTTGKIRAFSQKRCRPEATQSSILTRFWNWALPTVSDNRRLIGKISKD